jgi:ATP-binding cassette, subfamily C, bacterial
MGGRRAVIRNALQSFFDALGLPMNLVTLLLTILLFLVIKAVVSIVVTRYVASVMARINTEARLDVIRTLVQARWSFYTRQRLSRLVSAAGESSNAMRSSSAPTSSPRSCASASICWSAT